MPEFIIAQAARLDMFEVCEYFDAESRDPNLADRFVNSAILTFEKLARTPGLGRPYKFKKCPHENLRSRRVDNFPNYLIFYRPFPNGVEIVRVLHGARDLEAQFRQ
jgi:toxin ParE1/3/4